MNKLKDNKKVLMIFGVLVLALIAIGVTYAFFTYTQSGTTENSIKSGSITFWYDEQNQSGNSIGITDALPISDTDGKNQTNAFNFRITSTTGSNIAIPYTITLRQKANTDDIGNIVKVYLAKAIGYDAAVNTEEEVVTSLYSSLSDITKNGYSEKVLYRDSVPAGSSNYNQNYRLKMWVDESADYSDGTLNNKKFTVMVNVYAEAHTVSSNANITSVGINGTTLTATTKNTYETTLPQGTTSATLNIETEDEYTQVTVTKTASDYSTPIADNGSIQRLSYTQNKTLNLTGGDNYFKVVVNSEDNSNTKELHFRIRIITPLSTMILNDNPAIYTNPTLTTSSNKTSDANGLYSLSVTNGFGGQSEKGTTYYFRGNVSTNKVKFANLNWRVVRINEDGTVRLILDDSTDTSNHKFNAKINSTKYMYYSNSQAKTDVETWYNANITGINVTKVATGNYFCESAKTKAGSHWTSGSASMMVYSSYTPDLECQTDGNKKGLLNNSVGLINYDEVVLAGGYYNKSNKTYYLYKNFDWWTMSSAGYCSGCNASGAFQWYVVYNGYPYDQTLGYDYRLRPVINLKADVTATKDANGVYVVD